MQLQSRQQSVQYWREVALTWLCGREMSHLLCGQPTGNLSIRAALTSPSWLPESQIYYSFQYKNPSLGGLHSFHLLSLIPNTEQTLSPMVIGVVVVGGNSSWCSQVVIPWVPGAQGVGNYSRLNDIPPRYPYPNPWNLWMLPFMANGIWRRDYVKDFKMGKLSSLFR